MCEDYVRVCYVLIDLLFFNVFALVAPLLYYSFMLLKVKSCPQWGIGSGRRYFAHLCVIFPILFVVYGRWGGVEVGGEDFSVSASGGC